MSSRRDEIQIMNYCRQLSDFDPKIRRFAMKQLNKFASSISIPFLIKALSDSDTLVKTGAENTLIKIGEEVIPHVVELFKDSNAETRLRALSIYNSINTQKELHCVIPLLFDVDTEVRIHAKKRLMKNLNLEATVKLWETYKTTEAKNIKEEIETILLKNAADISDILLEEIFNDSLPDPIANFAVQLFLKLKPEGDPKFVDMDFLTHRLPYFRIAALLSHKTYKKEKVIDIARALSTDESVIVRKIAVSVIGEFGVEDDIPKLIVLMNDREMKVWHVAKNSINQIKQRLNIK